MVCPVTWLRIVSISGSISCASFALELPAKDFRALASESFREREDAQAALLTWGRERPGPAMEEFLEQSRSAPDPEVRERCHYILRELVMDEYLSEGEGYIGIGLLDEISMVPGDEKARSVIRVTQVQPETPADQAGILPNDLIVGFEDEIWRGAEASPAFREKVRLLKPKTNIRLKILRGGEIVDVDVKLGRRPPNADNPFLNDRNFEQEAVERAAKEAYFRRWMSQRKSAG